MTMDNLYIYEIRVEGHLTERWSEWFGGLVIHNDPNGESLLRGLFSDQAALFGVLIKIHDLNLTLISVQQSSSDANIEQSLQADLHPEK